MTTHYYVTTAIDYPNAAPHIGHALEKVAADVLARCHRLRGHDTYFSIGVDENSQHVVTAAVRNGAEPLAWVDRMDEAFRRTWDALDISHDFWIRTTSAQHVRASQEMFKRAQANGDIYTSVYSGWYCPNCNAYYTMDELINEHCPHHPALKPEWLEEENYFFALSRYSEQLLNHIETHPEFIVPASRRAEVVGLIRQGLRDFSVSRRVRPGATNWGIPVPGDPRQIIYVWFDALTNYLTAVGFPDNSELFAHYWPANAHVIGKDITRFHCLYWPAMLLSAKLPLPRQIAVHGFITLDGQRISKTTGNIIDPVELVQQVGVDSVRYFLLRNLSFTQDGDFSRISLVQHYNTDLANELGNLLNRVVSMTKRYCNGDIPPAGIAGPLEQDLQQLAEETRQRAANALEAWDIGGSLAIIWQLVRRANQYLEQSEPWKLAKQREQQERLQTVLYSAAEAVRIIAVLLAPYIPSSSGRILQQLGLDAVGVGAWDSIGGWGSVPLTQVVPGPLLFPRIETL